MYLSSNATKTIGNYRPESPANESNKVFVEGKPIKFDIVLEGRIGLAKPGKKDSILGVASLTKLDMAVSKLIANSDRGLDMGMHCRDVIDLAKVIGMLGEANGLLERCLFKKN